MKKYSLIPPISVFILGIVLALLSLYVLNDRHGSQVRAQTINHAYEVRDLIEREMLRSESVLRGIEGFFHSSDFVSRTEFRTFCSSSIQDEIPLHLIEWQPKVASRDRRKYERQARKDGIKDFTFFELDKFGKNIPAQKREYHFPVFYSYSREAQNLTDGLDLAFSPERMRSKYRAMELGSPVLSGTFDVIHKDSKEMYPGFAITQAIFNDPTISSSASLTHLKGFVAIVLYLDDFFAPLVTPERIKNFQFLVKDKGDFNKTIFTTLTKDSYHPEFQFSLDFEVGQRTWEVVVYPKKVFVESGNEKQPWIIFCLILALGTFIGFYLHLKGQNLEKINRIEKKLQQKQRLESLGFLASGIAHEFNNLLHCITLANENLKDSKEEQDKLDNLNISLDYCRKGQALVRQILSFARKEPGTLKEILPSDEINKVFNLLRPTTPKEISIILDLDEMNDKTLLMNSNHISQILINLVNNAVHAINLKGEVGTIQIHYEVTQKERVLKVIDDGAGIDDEVIGRIFDPFFTTKPVNEGTGLGLSVIYGIIKGYNGNIEAQSEKGKGSTFTLTFPIEN